jgi:hypothetical protein
MNALKEHAGTLTHIPDVRLSGRCKQMGDQRLEIVQQNARKQDKQISREAPFNLIACVCLCTVRRLRLTRGLVRLLQELLGSAWTWETTFCIAVHVTGGIKHEMSAVKKKRRNLHAQHDKNRKSTSNRVKRRRRRARQTLAADQVERARPIHQEARRVPSQCMEAMQGRVRPPASCRDSPRCYAPAVHHQSQELKHHCYCTIRGKDA